MNVYCHVSAQAMGYGSVHCYLLLGHEGDHMDGPLGIHWRKDEPGGDSEPAGDSPDSPAPGEARFPGDGGQSVTIEFAGDDPADLRENITPVSPEEFINA